MGTGRPNRPPSAGQPGNAFSREGRERDEQERERGSRSNLRSSNRSLGPSFRSPVPSMTNSARRGRRRRRTARYTRTRTGRCTRCYGSTETPGHFSRVPANILRTGRLQRGGERELRYGVVYVLNVYVHSGKTREEDVAERRKQMEGNWFYSN